MNITRKQSIKTYGIILTIIGAVLYASLAVVANNQLNKLSKKYEDKYVNLAKQELDEALTKLALDTNKLVSDLQNWEELLQQINDPTYYSYWLENRVSSVNFLPQYFRNITLYDKNFQSLAGSGERDLKNSSREKLGKNQVIIDSDHPVVHRCEAIREKYGKGSVLGYFCIDLDFLEGLKSVKTFNYLGNVGFIRKSRNSRDDDVIGIDSIKDKISLSVKKELSNSEFSQLTEDTIVYYLIVSAGFMFVFLYILLALIGVPLRRLSSFINNLKITGARNIPEIKEGYLEIAELETVYRSLSNYQERLEESAQELKRSEEHFRNLIENSSDIIMSMDNKGMIIYISPSVVGTLGYQQEEVIGKHIFEYVHSDDIDLARSSLDLSENIYDNLSANEFRFRHHDGTWVTLEASGKMLSEENDFYTLNCRDISERKIAQEAILNARDQALEASTAKSNFLANTSHELRTPLNAILGYSEIIAEDMANNDFSNVEGDIEKVHTAASSLLHLIDEVLDLSKIESGKMELSIEDISIKKLLAEIERTIKPLMNRNSNRLEINCSETVKMIKTDRNKLRQIIFNLLNNAAKFTHNGEVTLDVKVKKVNGRKWLDFIVTDTGVGMTPEQQERVFEPFIQADASTTRKYGGTGLGLTICRSFAHLMHGDISVQSEESVGSAFTLSLPEKIRSSVERFQPRQAS